MTSSCPCLTGMKLSHHWGKHIEKVMTTCRGNFIWSWIASKSFRNVPYRHLIARPTWRDIRVFVISRCDLYFLANAPPYTLWRDKCLFYNGNWLCNIRNFFFQYNGVQLLLFEYLWDYIRINFPAHFTTGTERGNLWSQEWLRWLLIFPAY